MARERMGCEVRLDLALYRGRSCVGSLGWWLSELLAGCDVLYSYREALASGS